MTRRARGRRRFTIEDLFEEHYRAVLHFATRATRDPQVGLDVTAETFAKAFEAWDRLRGDERQAQAWMWAIARNEIAGYWRSRRVHLAAVERLGLERPNPAASELADLARLIDDPAQLDDPFRLALERLPADQRVAVEGRILDDVSYERLAEQTGVSQQTIRQRVSRGLRALAADQELRPESAERGT